MPEEENTVIECCANRVMALQELQATGSLAAGFREAGCYACGGFERKCGTYTPLCWVYASVDLIPPAIRVFCRAEKPRKS